MGEVDRTSETIGGLSARMDNVEAELAELKNGVKSVLDILNQARGGWRVILGFCAFVGAIFGVVEIITKPVK
jgi:hypothetical protein